ncbi:MULTISPECIES: glycosyltransferase [unclassified Microbacterium]|uniref:glycosyltransferase n=1 Tax=unclassified Microbacterium TaxID=2609290 RepID=UPI001AC5DD33|nr:glycosyltransferase [Microbacterium sp.]MBN9157294.1 glycosyltransferase family 4 protein [Microbacterium sp.]MBS1896486.1 glycosyltransferase family 4 protein [Actinomycetota bacterium]
MRRAEFLVAKDPIRDQTGDMAMLRLVMSLARESLSVRYIGMGPQEQARPDGVIVEKPRVRLPQVAARALRTGRSAVHERFDVEAFRRAVAQSDADLFVADHAYMAEPFLATGRTSPLYVNTVVSESHVWSAAYGLAGRLQAPAIRRDERRIARTARSVGTYDEDEAAEYRAAGIDRVRWLDLTLRARADIPARDLDAPRVAFVGDRQWRPNAEGLRVLLEMWPRIRAGIPGAELVIVGRADTELQLPEGVRDLGFVDDLDGLLATCRAVLAPIRTGGGVRVKILEAASRGLPVVGTRAAIGSLDGVLGLTAVEGAEFIEEARRMLQDPAHARVAGEELDARNRAHWAEGAPQRAVAEWLA